MLPNRNATRLKLKKPIRPQFMAPTTAMVRVKYCRHLFDISHHPFVIQEIVFHRIKKIYTGMRKRKRNSVQTIEKSMARSKFIRFSFICKIKCKFRFIEFGFVNIRPANSDILLQLQNLRGCLSTAYIQSFFALSVTSLVVSFRRNTWHTVTVFPGSMVLM